ncbi:Box C/D snoRNA protein 1 [Cladorrhinum sp. PSN332]|nr:Box C/D snoRNA protein 1 [Cladorrhinum sp. PSN332]
MSSEVLSTLCSICHAEPPKYKCPRCLARTCSAACIQKHKTRADCDGQRNPRAFVPITELKSAAGIDHDFNFISSIERARERTEKEIIEARHLLSEKEIHHDRAKEDKLFRKVWQGDELQHVPIPQTRQNDHLNMDVVGFDKSVRRRLRHIDVEVVNMPKGMSRSKQNYTSFNRRTNTINWQVEWLVYDQSINPQQDKQQQQPLQILYKSLEGTPLFQALSTAADWHRARLEKGDSQSHRKNKRKRASPPEPPTQDFASSTWNLPSSFTTQSTLSSHWSISTALAAYPISQEEELIKCQFFLSKPKTKQLIPLQSTACLTETLRGRTVLEFPTILVFAPGEKIPDVYEILDGEGDRRAPRRTFDNMRGGRGRGGRGRGRGRGRGGNYRDDGRGGKRVRFERRPKEEDEEKVNRGPVSEDEGEVPEGVDVGVDAEKIKQVVEMDLDVMMGAGSGQTETRGLQQNVNGAGLLVDYGSDSD